MDEHDVHKRLDDVLLITVKPDAWKVRRMVISGHGPGTVRFISDISKACTASSLILLPWRGEMQGGCMESKSDSGFK